MPAKTGPALQLPVLQPPPVLTLSVNLNESRWIELLKDNERLAKRLGVALELFDEFGPAVHFAVMDADPVINLGSGDIFGALGGDVDGFSRSGEMFILPLALAGLTRPCKLIIELRNPERARKLLRISTGIEMDRGRSFDTRVELARHAKRDAWIYTIDIAGILKLRFGIEIQGEFLVISNIPWSQRIVVRRGDDRHLSSALLQVNPGAGKQQLPGLYAAAMEQQRQAAFRSAAYLYPLVLSAAATPNTAANRHQQLFGFKPSHPGSGSWSWQHETLNSSRFGSIYDPLQPSYNPGDRNFGLMRWISRLTVSMQFEDDGLRTRFRWSLIKE